MCATNSPTIRHLDNAMTDTGHTIITTVWQEDVSRINDPATVLQTTQDSFLHQHTPTQDTLDTETQTKIKRLPQVFNQAQRRQLENRSITMQEVRKAIQNVWTQKTPGTTSSLWRHTTTSPPTSCASLPKACGTASRDRPPYHRAGPTVRRRAGLTPFLEPGRGVPQEGAEAPFLYLLVKLALALAIKQDYPAYAPYPLRPPLVSFADNTNLTVAHTPHEPHTPGDKPTVTHQADDLLEVTISYLSQDNLIVHPTKLLAITKGAVTAPPWGHKGHA